MITVVFMFEVSETSILEVSDVVLLFCACADKEINNRIASDDFTIRSMMILCLVNVYSDFFKFNTHYRVFFKQF